MYTVDDFKSNRRSVEIHHYEHKTWIYSNDPKEAGVSMIHYSDIRNDPKGDYIELDGFSYNGLSVDLVSEANYKVITSIFNDENGLYKLYGDYHGHGILVHKDLLEDQQMQDILHSLENYPCLNDEIMSELEEELYQESWSSWIRHDLISRLWRLDYNYPDNDDDFRAKFNRLVRELNIIREVTSEGISIDIDKVIEHWNDKRKYKHH